MRLYNFVTLQPLFLLRLGTAPKCDWAQAVIRPGSYELLPVCLSTGELRVTSRPPSHLSTINTINNNSNNSINNNSSRENTQKYQNTNTGMNDLKETELLFKTRWQDIYLYVYKRKAFGNISTLLLVVKYFKTICEKQTRHSAPWRQLKMLPSMTVGNRTLLRMRHVQVLTSKSFIKVYQRD